MTTHDPAAPVKNGDVFAGKYVVDRVIGSGAMGVVVVATHTQLHEQVVLKFLRHDVAQRADVVARFLREARSAVRIRNEHVARIIDIGTTESGLPYIVMEYLEGCDLRELLRVRGPLPIGDAADYVAQACLAMVEAHAAGVVHRDLKPSNLFLTRRSDGSPLVKVLDFGISKVITESSDQTDITSTHGILGSPIYISPEQAKCARMVDARADVWSLGVILHHLLTGRPPFLGDTITEVLSAILFSAPTRLTEARSDAPIELEAVILKCLSKDVEQRTPSVAKLAEALEPWTQPESRLAIARISSAPAPSLRVTASIAPAVPQSDGTARTMTGWAASGLRLRTPDVAKAVAAGVALGALFVTGSNYFAGHRPLAQSEPSSVPSAGPLAVPASLEPISRPSIPSLVRASQSLDALAPAGPVEVTGAFQSSDATGAPASFRATGEPASFGVIGASSDITVASQSSDVARASPSANVVLAPSARSSPPDAEGLRRVTRLPSKPNTVAPPSTVASRAGPNAGGSKASSSPTYGAGIDPGLLTFDLGGKPSNDPGTKPTSGQSSR